MQQDEPPDIKWRTSAARTIILEDLEETFLPLTELQFTTEDAWRGYRHLPELSLVPFSQFKRQLKAHREQVCVRKETLGEEEAALIQFRMMNPQQKFNNRFEPVFDMMPGKELLRQDIKDGLHLTMCLVDFRNSRPEFGCLTRKKFKERVYQEIR